MSKLVDGRVSYILKKIVTAYSISNLDSLTERNHYLLLEKLHKKDPRFFSIAVVYVSDKDTYPGDLDVVVFCPTIRGVIDSESFYKFKSEYKELWWILPYTESWKRYFDEA